MAASAAGSPTITLPGPATSGPSFLISGSSGSATGDRAGLRPDPIQALRLDRLDSRVLLAAARRVLLAYRDSAGDLDDPSGVVLSGDQRPGRVVFGLPVLLPQEQFVPLELIRGGGRRSRGRRCSPARVRLSRRPSSPP